MTPEDLIRSLTPGGELQPSHLLLDQYRKIKTSQVQQTSIGAFTYSNPFLK